MHRLGASIVRANAIEHARPGQRRSIIPIAIFASLLGAVAWGIISQLDAIQRAASLGMLDMGRAIVREAEAWARLEGGERPS